YYQHSSGWTF
nr:immunoglobulin light chain junction region [Macaca mulatta]